MVTAILASILIPDTWRRSLTTMWTPLPWCHLTRSLKSRSVAHCMFRQRARLFVTVSIRLKRTIFLYYLKVQPGDFFFSWLLLMTNIILMSKSRSQIKESLTPPLMSAWPLSTATTTLPCSSTTFTPMPPQSAQLKVNNIYKGMRWMSRGWEQTDYLSPGSSMLTQIPGRVPVRRLGSRWLSISLGEKVKLVHRMNCKYQRMQSKKLCNIWNNSL